MDDNSYKDFVDRIDSICTQCADKTAITYLQNNGSKTCFTFGKIFRYILSAKAQLETIGIRSGDRVAIIAPHSPYAIISGLLLAYINNTSVLIDATLPHEEINRLLELSDVSAILTVYDTYDCLDRVIITDIPVCDITTITDRLKVFDGSTENAKEGVTRDIYIDVITILFSSGTTASAKGVMITYESIIKSRDMCEVITGYKAGMSFLHILPFSHIAGYSSAFAHFFTGCELCMIEDIEPRKLVKGFIECQPHYFTIVPRVYEVIEEKIRQEIHNKGTLVERIINMLLALSVFMRSRLGVNIGRLLFGGVTNKIFGKKMFGLGTGAAICKESTAKLFYAFGYVWANFYATTETGVPTVGTGITDRIPFNSEGFVNKHQEISVKIHSPDENGIGEIRVKTSLIMKGYFRDPELTSAAFDEDGYFKTGDLGYIDSKDYLHITGRIKEAILMHTGKKVAPSDVDALYGKLCPEVRIASCGVQRKNKTYDEIHIFIEIGELTLDKQQELKKRIMELSAQTSTLYQISKVHFIDKLPTTSVGKVKRFQLQEAALAQ